MKVFAIDPSLTSTGLALIEDEEIIVRTVASSGKRADTISQRDDRIQAITDATIRWAYPRFTDDAYRSPNLIVIEGPTPGTRGGSVWDRAGLWWRIVSALPTGNVAVIPPPSRAKWATNNGRADKAAVASVMSRMVPDLELRNSDEADAVALGLMGCHALGIRRDLPLHNKYRHEALMRCAWPADVAKRLLAPYERYEREVIA